MPLVTITRKAEALQSYKLNSPGDMVAALLYMVPGGYSGNVGVGTDGVWGMTFSNANANVGQAARIGDYIIVTNGVLASVCTEADYAILYQ